VKKIFLLVLLVSALSGYAQTQVGSPAAGDSSLQAFLARWEECITRFINGDPTLWKQNASHRDDVTIFGAFGGHEKGWKEVGPRYDWASSQFKESGAKVRVEYLNSGVDGGLAFTVTIEREQVRLADQNGLAPRALRVTQIFRKEDGAWKLLHRHADPLIDKKAPPTVSLLQNPADAFRHR